jgi:nanoRNase/pAp phosphatase (c-di-AMP/oligoRNAs hydrolase)
VDELDVSAIARKSGGGGHRQAAGFSSEHTIEEITSFVLEEFRSMRPVGVDDGARLGGA